MKQKKDQPDLKLQLFRRARELGELIPVPQDPRDKAQLKLFYERRQMHGKKHSAYMEVFRDLGLFEEFIEWDALWEHHE